MVLDYVSQYYDRGMASNNKEERKDGAHYAQVCIAVHL